MWALTTWFVLAALTRAAVSERGIIVTAPEVWVPGAMESVCVTFHGIDFRVKASAQLSPPDDSESPLYVKAMVFDGGEDQCFDMSVPQDVPYQDMVFKFKASAEAPVSYNFEETGKINIQQAANQLTLIQTDKPMYKPAQTVKFRVLKLNVDLRPSSDAVDQVYIEDPQGIRVAQWPVQPRGLLDLEFPLASDPVLGTWKIIVVVDEAKKEKEFKVDEYVLPKYEVVIKPPSYLLINSKAFEFEICAMYTYGEPVKGIVSAEVSVESMSWNGQFTRSRGRPVVQRQGQIDGCAKFTVDSDELELDSTRHSMWKTSLRINATVEELDTGVLLNALDRSCGLKRTPLDIKFESSSPDYFKPYLPYNGKLLVTYPDGAPAAGELIEIRIKELFENYTTDAAGQISFSLPLSGKPDHASFSISARAVKMQTSGRRGHRNSYDMNTPSVYKSIRQWYSPSESYLQIHPLETEAACDTQLRVPVSYTAEPRSDLVFRYQVMARGGIVRSGSHAHKSGALAADDRVASFHLGVPVTAAMAGGAKLLVYYVREDGETVADSTDIPVEECLPNKVSLSFNHGQRFPGETVKLRLEADSGSLCSVGAVDKSMSLLAGSDALTPAKIFGYLNEYRKSGNSRMYEGDEYCMKKLREEEEAERESRQPPLPPVKPPRRGPRSIAPWGGPSYSDYYDAIHAFTEAGVFTLTDVTMETRPCRHPMFDSIMVDSPLMGAMPGMIFRDNVAMAPGAAAPSQGEVSKEIEDVEGPSGSKQVELRAFFPETWLWDLISIGDSGRQDLKETLPHTITEWVANAFCTNSETGLGVAAPARVTAFQPFFLSYTLPYSVIRGETIALPVTVFNYLDECLAIKLSLASSTLYSLANRQDRRETVCVCGKESVTHRYNLVPTALGEVNVTVKAISVSNDGTCGNRLMSSETGARDALVRPLLVEPEGIEEEKAVSSFICPTEDGVVVEEVDLELPANLVADSARGYASVIGDVMGSSLSGLDSLLRMPTGCGEQNMILFAPNIFVMQYLTSTDQVTTEIRTKSLNFMKTGYQRELNYRHLDSSFSAFGTSDPEGSMWLTAFVVKSFAEARPFIYISDDDLYMSIEWIRSRQLENGCFPQIGRVIHSDMKGGLSASGENPAPLTAFVLVALLEAGTPVTDPVVEQAVQCINMQTWNDSYTMALVAYAYSMLGEGNPYVTPALDRLRGMAHEHGGVMYWSKSDTNAPPTADEPPTADDDSWRRHQAPSADVEMTAYALMAFLSQGGSTSVITARPIVKWMTSQRNAEGGFVSTQDTVVALQALAKFASLIYSTGTNLSVEVRGSGLHRSFQVDPGNKLLLQRQEIVLPNKLAFTTTGQGCVFIQTTMKYHVEEDNSNPVPAFSLEVRSARTSHCERRVINVCARYTGNRLATDMAVIEVKMVTGWVPVKESLDKLRQDTSLGLKRYDLMDGSTSSAGVNFYFDEMDRTEKCLSFEVHQEQETRDPKEKVVLIYDYYDKANSHVYRMYNLPTICGTKEEIPLNPPDGFDQGGVVQVRQPVRPPKNWGRHDDDNEGDHVEGGQVGPLRTDFRNDTVDPPLVEVFSSCPRCLAEVPDDLDDLYCDASHVYKLRRRGKGKFRVYYDLRAAKRTKLDIDVQPEMDSDCECPIIDGSTKNVLAVVGSSEILEAESLRLDEDVTLMPNSKAVEKKLKKRRKKCDKKVRDL
nr:alpha-2-macroglobulin-like protein [Arenicola marina]